MKKNCLGLLISLLSTVIIAQNVKLEWAKSIGGTSNDYGYSIIIDDYGNVYTTGTFVGTVDFDPSAAVYNLSSSGFRNIFIQKLDPSGNFVWAKSMGEWFSNIGYSLTTDLAGNIYTTGYFENHADFDPGPSTFNLTSKGNEDVFVQKLDPNGNFVWANSIGGVSEDYGQFITTDILGNVYITETFKDSADFDPDTSSFYLTSNGAEDVFIQKLDSSGNLIWTKSFGGTLNDLAESIAIDALGNIYTTGFYWGTSDFNPGVSTFNLTSNGGPDFYVQKLDPNGNFVWAKSMGGLAWEKGYAIDTDTLGNVYVTGRFSSTVDFDPSAATFNLTSNGGEDIFIQKLDANGNLIWVKSFGGLSSDCGFSINIDPSGNIYTTGLYSYSADFNPGIDTFNLTANGIIDVFVQKLDASGNFVWAKSMGGTNFDVGYSITSDISGNVYVTGFFMDTADFNPGWGVFNLTSNGSRDIFIQKLSPCAPITGTDIVTACDSIVWSDGITYRTNNNTAIDTLASSTGCDSVVTLNLTIMSSSIGIDIINACDSITWSDGNTYISDNSLATDTFTNTLGCDSVVTLNLTINHYNIGNDVITACNTYTWIDGNTYTSHNNSAKHTLINSGGCDSIVTLNLNMITVDVSVVPSGSAITVKEAGANYQWLDCNNNYVALNGEIDQTFIASVNGNYAVEVTKNGCTDTSECTTISTVGLYKNYLFNNVSIFPNPTTGILSINLGKAHPKVVFNLTNIQGQIIESWSFENINKAQLYIQQPKGIYLLYVKVGQEQSIFKIVKE